MTRPAPLLRLVLVAATLAAAGLPRTAHASKADAFEGKVEPISGQLYRKAGRFELTPTYDLSLNDAFFQKHFLGVKLGYHFNEVFSLSAQYAGAIGNLDTTGSAVVCPANQGCHPATATQLYQVPGYLRSIAGLEVAFSPIYGKLNLLAERVAHIDLSVLAGADAFVYRKVLSAADAAALPSGQSPPDATKFGGHVGLGMRIFFSPAVAARIELKDYIYVVPVPNWVEGGGKARQDVQNQLFAELGVSVFFPFSNRAAP